MRRSASDYGRVRKRRTLNRSERQGSGRSGKSIATQRVCRRRATEKLSTKLVLLRHSHCIGEQQIEARDSIRQSANTARSPNWKKTSMMKNEGMRTRTFALGISSPHPQLASRLADHTHTDGLVSEPFGFLLGLSEDHAVLELGELGLSVGFLLGSRSGLKKKSWEEDRRKKEYNEYKDGRKDPSWLAFVQLSRGGHDRSRDGKDWPLSTSTLLLDLIRSRKRFGDFERSRLS